MFIINYNYEYHFSSKTDVKEAILWLYFSFPYSHPVYILVHHA